MVSAIGTGGTPHLPRRIPSSLLRRTIRQIWPHDSVERDHKSCDAARSLRNAHAASCTGARPPVRDDELVRLGGDGAIEFDLVVRGLARVRLTDRGTTRKRPDRWP